MNNNEISYKNNKGKECKPYETINKIKSILKQLNISVSEYWKNPLKEFYWVHLKIDGTNLYSNGKGETEEYALASGYGELMERLQTFALFRFHYQFTEKEKGASGFIYAPDERNIRLNDILKEPKKYNSLFWKEGENYEEKLNILKGWSQIEKQQFGVDDFNEPLETDLICTVPFINMFTRERAYFPVKPLDLMYGSNGMCAGNTPMEAILQGLSEIIERNVNKRIILEKITPPDIPVEYIKANCPTSYTMIRELEKDGKYKIIVKDCSLGEGYPVVAILLIDKILNKYFVKFGAQPIMDIALERALTELLQGRSLESSIYWMKDYSYLDEKAKTSRNIENTLHTGDGYYPKEFFSLEYSYEFSPQIIVSEYSNESFLKKLIKLIKKSEKEIFIRDVSFLGFPSYQIIVPGFSEIYESNIERINWHHSYYKAKISARKLGKAKQEDFDNILNFMKLNGYTNEESVENILGLPIERKTEWWQLKTDIFRCLVDVWKCDYINAYIHINKFVDEKNHILDIGQPLNVCVII